uniref:Putative plant transposon protein domain-containing protein n=1 Tax=Cajanus cajan TaxID=3821 RepID=A0A151RMX1_CAJCA|nr:hypothetical protein KK1_034674 [Cajanus cajan]
MEKMVKLKPTEYPEFQAKIQRRKWEKLAYYMAPANISVVREFYCNARVLSNDFPEYASYVRDIMIRFDATINTFLGTHLTEGLRYYEYSDWVARSKNYRLVERMVCKPGKGFQYTSRGKISHILREDLIPMAKVWVAFIHANLSPCCHTSDVLESRALLLYAIMDRKAIDVGALIAEEIRHCSQHTGILGHPSLITHLCHRSRVDVTETPFEKLKMPINKVYIDTYYYKETNRRTASTSASSSRAPPPVSDMESRRLEACPSPESIKLKGITSTLSTLHENAAATSAKAKSMTEWWSRMAETASSVERLVVWSAGSSCSMTSASSN